MGIYHSLIVCFIDNLLQFALQLPIKVGYFPLLLSITFPLLPVDFITPFTFGSIGSVFIFGASQPRIFGLCYFLCIRQSSL